MGNFIIQMIGLIIVFCSILFLAYITTRFIGGKARQTMNGKHLKLIENISLGVDKRIYLVKAGNKFIVISSCGKSMGYLTDIELPDLKEEELGERDSMQTAVFGTFRKNLEKIRNLTERFGNKDGNKDDK